jgi:exodeoxyribonuclease VII large subunit
VAALSPGATLERGYAVVQKAADGTVVRSPSDVDDGDGLRVRVAAGELTAVVGAVVGARKAAGKATGKTAGKAAGKPRRPVPEETPAAG